MGMGDEVGSGIMIGRKDAIAWTLAGRIFITTFLATIFRLVLRLLRG